MPPSLVQQKWQTCPHSGDIFLGSQSSFTPGRDCKSAPRIVPRSLQPPSTWGKLVTCRASIHWVQKRKQAARWIDVVINSLWVDSVISQKCIKFTQPTKHPSLETQFTSEYSGLLLWSRWWLWAVAPRPTQHLEWGLVCISLAQEKIQFQNSKYDFYWLYITLIPS